MEISVIIPIRINESRSDILERLSYAIRPESGGVEYIVVDDGSLPKDAAQLERCCARLGIRYVSTQARTDALFNLARARNFGAQVANGSYILFLDVDLLPYPGFYEDLKLEIELADLKNNIDLFIMCPVVYLNDEGYAAYLNELDRLKKHFSSELLAQGNIDLYEKYSHGTSCVLLNRCYYLSIGGQNENFEGWGYEDYEFTTRLINLARIFPKPKKYESMAGNFMNIKEYKGWKAEYRLYGAKLGQKGIYLAHAPHQTDVVFKSKRRIQANQKLLEQSLQKNWKNEPIQSIFPQQEYSLILSENPFCLHYKLNSLFGRWQYYDYKQCKNIDEFVACFRRHSFTQVVFPNPYGDELLKEFYDYCVQNKIKYFICERGALPDSIFHDPNGFLFDSSSYDSCHWDVSLSQDQKKDVEGYLESLKKGGNTLEAQPKRLNKRDFNERLNIPNKAFVVGVILQTENDTVIKFFGREFKSLDAVGLFIEKLINVSDSNTHFVYKNHPLEVNSITIVNAVCADGIHVHDFIDNCDAVITVNSGAGLIAALLGKPVFVLGDCWYAHPGIACQVNSGVELLKKLKRFTPSKDKLHRFAYYLRFRFYSFGHQHTVLHEKKSQKINWRSYRMA